MTNETSPHPNSPGTACVFTEVLRSRVDLFKLEETYFVAGLQQNLRGPRNLKNELRAPKWWTKINIEAGKGTLLDMFGIHLWETSRVAQVKPIHLLYTLHETPQFHRREFHRPLCPRSNFIYSNNINFEDFCQVSLGVPGRVFKEFTNSMRVFWSLWLTCYKQNHVTCRGSAWTIEKTWKKTSLKISPWKWKCWTQSHGGGWFR